VVASPLSFLVVPQWQGSGSSRALRIADGALAIGGDLPASSTTVIEVPPEAGDEQGSGVARLSSLVTVRDRMTDALLTLAAPVVTIGGDCGVELAAIAHASGRNGEGAPRMAVVWFDAHPDLNTPESSPSGAFTGMVLRTLLGEGPEQLVPTAPLEPGSVILAGARALDSAEAAYVADAGIRSLSGTELTAESLVEAVAATGATDVYVHVDLDVLDPGSIEGLGYPVPFGLSPAQLVELIRALRGRFALAGAGITEFAPSSREQADDDLPTILRIIGALAAAPS
jgi:arginase